MNILQINRQLKYILVLFSGLGLTGLQAQEDAIGRDVSSIGKGFMIKREQQLSDSFKTVKDIDGNIYNIVTIGQQEWMGGNLKTTRYNDGTSIPMETDNSAWRELASPAYCWYNNDEKTYKNSYGALYNWYTVYSGKLCPAGWHIPAHDEWTYLFTYLGGTNVGNSKLIETGFNPLLGGARIVHSESEGGYFGAIEYRGGWWSSNAGIQTMRIDQDGVNRQNADWIIKKWGFSVRCLKNCDEETSLPFIATVLVVPASDTTANSVGRVFHEGGDSVTDRGVCWSTSENPAENDRKISSGAGAGEFVSSIAGLIPGTRYYVRAYATNKLGTAYGNQLSLIVETTIQSDNTVTDADGNTYNTVIIGSQVWMAGNLKTTRYNDFTAIPLVTDNTGWHSTSSPAYCWYNNDEAACKKLYGALYNWHAVETGKLCPAGWHVPTDDEWKQLEIYIGMGQNFADSVGSRGTNEGGKLKAPGFYWRDHREGAANESGFSALPGGARSGFDGTFHGNIELTGEFGCWWTSTEYIMYNPLYRCLACNDNGILRRFGSMEDGLSVRCLRDD